MKLMASKGRGVRQRNKTWLRLTEGKKPAQKEWEFQARLDELLERAGDAPWQREMRQLEEQLREGESLTKTELRQLWEGLVKEEQRIEEAMETGDHGWLRQERWAGISAELDVVEKKLGIGLE